MRVTHGLLCMALMLVATAASASSKTDKVLENVRLPTGFKIEVYSDQVPGARSMALGQRGTLFVGTRARGGKVYAVTGTPGAAGTPAVHIIANNLNTPNDCLRTVNVSRAPWPWRLITTPSNTWVRRRVPSMTWK